MKTETEGEFTDAPSCENCIFWENKDGMGRVHGECHRWPGKMAVEVGIFQNLGDEDFRYFKGVSPAQMIFPQTCILDFCGEFKPKQTRDRSGGTIGGT